MEDFDMNRKFVVKLLSTIALTTLIVSVGGGTVVFAEGEPCTHNKVALIIGDHDPNYHNVICDREGCGKDFGNELHTSSGEYYSNDSGHAFTCSKCYDYIGSLEGHTWSWFVCAENQNQHAKSCDICGHIDVSSYADHNTNGPNGGCSKCGHVADPGCQPTPSTPAPEKEDKEEEKKSEEKISGGMADFLPAGEILRVFFAFF